MAPKPAPSIMVANSLLFSGAEIEAFENLLDDRNSNEHDISRILKWCPKFLNFNGLGEFKWETVLESESTNRRVDIFKRQLGNRWWDLIELKHPHAQLVSGIDTLHPHFSSRINDAISQAEDYRELLANNGSIRTGLLRQGIQILRPRILVIAGQNRKESHIEILEILRNRRRNGGVEINTYSEILSFAKEHYASTQTIVIPASDFVINSTTKMSLESMLHMMVLQFKAEGGIVYGADFSQLILGPLAASKASGPYPVRIPFYSFKDSSIVAAPMTTERGVFSNVVQLDQRPDLETVRQHRIGGTCMVIPIKSVKKKRAVGVVLLWDGTGLSLRPGDATRMIELASAMADQSETQFVPFSPRRGGWRSD